MLLRRACLEDLGGLDEQFFLYYEDVDLCHRARLRNWRIWYDPALAVTRHSLLTFARKHWPAWQARLLARIVRAEGTWRSWWGRWQGDPHEARIYRHLRDLAEDFLADEPGTARQRLEAVIAKLDVRVGV